MSEGRIPCPSRVAVDLWMDAETNRARGRCSCGYEGWVTTSGRMYSHSRLAPGFAAPGLTRYQPSYNLGVITICGECGGLVMDTDAHDDFHNTIVEDLNLLRKELAGDPVPNPKQRVRDRRGEQADPPTEGGGRANPTDWYRR